MGNLPVAGFALRVVLSVLFASAWPAGSYAADAGGALHRSNSEHVAYRLQGVALIKDSKGNRVEASLADAPLGAGDRVRYLVIATNEANQPQVPGVSISIPEFTVWEPPKDVSEADIVEWSLDGTHWQSGTPKNPAQVHAIRWTLSDVLMPRMSTAFAFELRLTGPYSDRTGDLNATRLTNVHPLVELANDQVHKMQATHTEQEPQRGPGLTDPLKIGALLENPKSAVEYNGLKMVEIATRNDVMYRATGMATVHAANGVVRSIPVSRARLTIGDSVAYAFLAQNVGDATRMAGATFVLPSYTRFRSAATRGDGIIEVTDDFVHWYEPSKLAPEKVRGLRWAYDGKLSARESAAFQVLLDVIGTPNTEDINSDGGGATFEALSPSTIQSVKFTNDLSASAANAGKDIATQVAQSASSFDGVPITSKLADSVAHQVIAGVVKSDATPVPTPEPRVAKKADTPDITLAGLFIGGGCLALVFFLFAKAGGGAGSDPNAMHSGGTKYKPERVGGKGFGTVLRGRLTETAGARRDRS